LLRFCTHLSRDLDVAEYLTQETLEFETELERQERATLLDRALGQLPIETHDLLVQRSIQESNDGANAKRLGLSQARLDVISSRDSFTTLGIHHAQAN